MNNKNGKAVKKKGAPRDTLAEKILNVCIVIAVFVLVTAVYSFVSEYREYGKGYFTEEYVIGRLQDGDYAGIVDAYYSGWEDVSEDPEREEISSLARYIDATFLNRALESCEMTERAAAEKRKMEDNVSKLGIYAGEKENIDRAIEENPLTK
ncbi:MAG: hypothetical protein Q4C58_01670 [Eubacteriales bacterium]|nr:hypothetical protein [Eubacteriales bacterium]